MTSAENLIAKWRQYPVEFVRDNFKVEPDMWQAKLLNAFANRDAAAMRIALKACAGPGKTAGLAWCGWNFLACYGERGEHPKGAAISVTADNLKDNLWPEMSKWQQRSEFLRSSFVWTKERVFARDHPETWFLSARTFSKSADKETQGRTLSGLHSKYILYLIDESGDIPPAILRSAEQGLATIKPGEGFGKILQAGNPTSLEGVLYHSCVTQAHMWTVINITGDPDDPERSPRIDIEWARNQIKEWGRDNPWVMSYILSKFPPASINQLLGIEEVEAAMNRGLRPDVYEWAQKRLGIDVARFGDDRTVLFPRQGLRSFLPAIMRHSPTDKPSVDIASRCMLAKQRWGQEREYFDDTVGWAHGAIDVMRAAGHNSVVAVNFASTHVCDPRYYNMRSQCWMSLAKWVRDGGQLPRIPELKRELTAPTYTYQNGKFLIEDKKLIKARLGFSPDLGDALANTFAEPDMPGSTDMQLLLPQAGKVLTEYDPFAEKPY